MTLNKLLKVAHRAYTERTGTAWEEAVAGGDTLFVFVDNELQSTYDPERPVAAAIEALKQAQADLQAVVDDLIARDLAHRYLRCRRGTVN